MVQMNTTLTCHLKFMTNIYVSANTAEGTARLAQSVHDYEGWMTWGSRDPYFPCNIQTSSCTTCYSMGTRTLSQGMRWLGY